MKDLTWRSSVDNVRTDNSRVVFSERRNRKQLETNKKVTVWTSTEIKPTGGITSVCIFHFDGYELMVKTAPVSLYLLAKFNNNNKSKQSILMTQNKNKNASLLLYQWVFSALASCYSMIPVPCFNVSVF